MERRTALTLLGSMVAIAGGTAVAEQSEPLEFFTYEYIGDFFFNPDAIKNIIIENKDGSVKLVIPFSDIVKALEEFTAYNKGVTE